MIVEVVAGTLAKQRVIRRRVLAAGCDGGAHSQRAENHHDGASDHQ